MGASPSSAQLRTWGKALAVAVPLVALGTNITVPARAPDVDTAKYVSRRAELDRMYPPWTLVEETSPWIPRDARRDAGIPRGAWSDDFAVEWPSAATASSVGVPESPSSLLKRLTRLREREAAGPGGPAGPSSVQSEEELADLERAVQFWDQYWVEKMTPLLRWVRSPQHHSPLDSMSADTAAASGVSDAWAARRAYVRRLREGVAAHFAFFERLKDAVAGTPLQSLLAHFSDRGTEWALAGLPGPTPSAARYLDPALPSERPRQRGAAVASMAREHAGVTRADSRPIAGGLTASHAAPVAFLCGSGVDVCAPSPPTDSMVRDMRAVWENQGYASHAFARNALKVLGDVHAGEPAVFLSQEEFYIHFHSRKPPKLGMPRTVFEKEMDKAWARATTAGVPLEKVVFHCIRSDDVKPLFLHAVALVVDLRRDEIRLFDPHGALLSYYDRQKASVDAALTSYFENPTLRPAFRGHSVAVRSTVASRDVAAFVQEASGPQMLQAMADTGHEGSCNLWTLWVMHMAAQLPTASLQRALKAGLVSIFHNADVDLSTRGRLLGRGHTEPPRDPGSRVSLQARHRAAVVLYKFIHSFAMQTMSLMKPYEVNSIAIDAGYLPHPTQGRVGSTLYRPEEPLNNPRAQAEAALALLSRVPRTGDASTLHRLWRLRQGFLTPKYVADASEEAFGVRHAPPDRVLRFLRATEFLEEMVEAGEDLGPTVIRRLTAEPQSSASETWGEWWRRQVRDPGSAGPADSFSSEVSVSTGSFV